VQRRFGACRHCRKCLRRRSAKSRGESAWNHVSQTPGCGPGRLVMLIAYSKIVAPSTISCATAVTLWLKIFFRGGDLVVAQLSHKFVRSLPWAMGEAFFNTLYGV